MSGKTLGSHSLSTFSILLIVLWVLIAYQLTQGKEKEREKFLSSRRTCATGTRERCKSWVESSVPCSIWMGQEESDSDK